MELMIRTSCYALLAVLAGAIMIWGMSGSVWALLALLVLVFVGEGVEASFRDWRGQGRRVTNEEDP